MDTRCRIGGVSNDLRIRIPKIGIDRCSCREMDWIEKIGSTTDFCNFQFVEGLLNRVTFLFDQIHKRIIFVSDDGIARITPHRREVNDMIIVHFFLLIKEIINFKIMYNVNTGDILLFARTSFQSNWFRMFTDSPYEHVGIAIRLKLDPEEMRDKNVFDHLVLPGEPFDPMKTHLYVMDQMMKEEDYDYLTGEYTAGFRIAAFNSRCKNYREIMVRSLRSLDNERSEKFKEKFITFCEKHRGRKFLKGKMNILKFWLGKEPDEKDGLTCSSLAADFMRDVLGKNVYLYLGPKDFLPGCEDASSVGVEYLYHNNMVRIHQQNERIMDNIFYLFLFMVLWIIVFGFLGRNTFVVK